MLTEKFALQLGEPAASERFDAFFILNPETHFSDLREAQHSCMHLKYSVTYWLSLTFSGVP